MKRRLFIAAAGLAAFTGLVIACGDDDTSTPPVTLLDGGRDSASPNRDSGGDTGVDSSSPVDGGRDAGDASDAGDATDATDADAGSLAAPTFSLPSGSSFGRPQCLSITASAGATIHYTTDGSTPTEASPTFSTPIIIDDPTTTVKAFAVAGSAKSAIVEATYQYTSAGGDGPVVFTPGPGAYDASVSVKLAAPDWTGICYTLDGSAPGCVSADPLPAFTCVDSGAPTFNLPTCSAAIAYDGGTIELSADAGESITVYALGCRGGATNGGATQSVYTF